MTMMLFTLGLFMWLVGALLLRHSLITSRADLALLDLLASQMAIAFGGVALGSFELRTSFIFVGDALVAFGLCLYLIHRLEILTGTAVRSRVFMGLKAIDQRSSMFFILIGLIWFGFPGGFGFIAEDLLLHHSIELGIGWALYPTLILSLQALSFFKLYEKIFLGPLREDLVFSQHRDHKPATDILIPVLGSLLLILMGLFPRLVLRG